MTSPLTHPTPIAQQIQDLPSKMDESLVSLKEAFHTAENEVLLKKKLCALLPANLPMAPSGMDGSRYVSKAEVGLDFSNVSREQALQLLSVLPGLPLQFVVGGVAAFVPEELEIPSNHRYDKLIPIGEMVYRISDWLGKTREKYFWWTRLGDMLVRVTATSSEKTDAIVKHRIIRDSASFRKVHWYYEKLPKGEVTRWYSSGVKTLVPLTVHVPREQSIVEAFTQFQMRTEVRSGSTCDC